MNDKHTVWTVDSTSYLRNLGREDLREECIAIHYQNPPVHNEENGTTSYSMCFPTLIVSLYIGEQREMAERVAAILNKHWDAFEADVPESAVSQYKQEKANG